MASEAKASDVTEHEFSALNMLLFCFMMALCVIAGYLLKKYKFYYLPESAAVMAIGAVLGGIVKAASQSQERSPVASLRCIWTMLSSATPPAGSRRQLW